MATSRSSSSSSKPDQPEASDEGILSVQAKESSLSRGVHRNYKSAPANECSTDAWQIETRSFRLSFLSFLCSVFLPEGYPHSVSEDYMTYQFWDTIQALCSTLTGLLCTKAILTGVGVGDAEATPVAATVQYVTRDVTGMVGRILFAWLKGGALDRDAKSWRLFADILNDVAMIMELLAPLFPGLFLALVCAGSIARSMVGVAGGATRAALTMHQARAGNLADVSAKDGSQETAVNIIGLLSGLLLLKLVANSQTLTWVAFLTLTAMHLYANYRGVSSCVMDTLNDQRLDILLTEHLNSGKDKRVVLSPKQVAAKESVSFLHRTNTHNCHIGSPLESICSSPAQLCALQASSKTSPFHYLISISEQRGVHVCLLNGASEEDILLAAIHAQIIARTGSRIFAFESARSLLASLSTAGWKTSRNLLLISDWRIELAEQLGRAMPHLLYSHYHPAKLSK